MKATNSIMLMLMIIIAPLCATAATLENLDFKKYDYQIVTKGGVLSSGTIYEQSSLYGICDFGCRIKLLETNQTLFVNPDDHVVIDGGLLKLKEESEQIIPRPGGSSESTGKR